MKTITLIAKEGRQIIHDIASWIAISSVLLSSDQANEHIQPLFINIANLIS